MKINLNQAIPTGHAMHAVSISITSLQSDELIPTKTPQSHRQRYTCACMRISPPAVRNELGVSAEVGGQFEEALLKFLHTPKHPHHAIFMPGSRTHAQIHAYVQARMHAQTPVYACIPSRNA